MDNSWISLLSRIDPSMDHSTKHVSPMLSCSNRCATVMIAFVGLVAPCMKLVLPRAHLWLLCKQQVFGKPTYLYLQTSHCQKASARWLVLRHCSRHCLCTYLLLPEHMHGQIKGLAGSWLGEVSVSKQMRHVPSTGALLLLHEGALLPAEASLRKFLTLLLLLWLWQISGAITTAVLSRSDFCPVWSRGVPSPAAAESSGILNH